MPRGLPRGASLSRGILMTEAIILMGGMGLAISIILAIASKVFSVYVDPKILAIEEALPGAN